MTRRLTKTRIKSGDSGGNSNRAPVWNPSMLKIGDSAKALIAPWMSPVTDNYFEIIHNLRITTVNPETGEEESLYVPSRRNFHQFGTDEWDCPVTKIVSEGFDLVKELKEENDPDWEPIKEISSSLWGYKNYIMQGFMLDAGNFDSNKLVVLNLAKSVGSIIEETAKDFEQIPFGSFGIEDIQCLMDGVMPDDIEDEDEFNALFDAYPFMFSRKQQGEYASYNSSRWISTPEPYTDEQLSFILDNGYYQQKDYAMPELKADHYQVLAEEVVPVLYEMAIAGEMIVWDDAWTEALGGLRPKTSEEWKSGHDGKSSSGGLKDRIKSRRGSVTSKRASTNKHSNDSTEDDVDEVADNEVVEKTTTRKPRTTTTRKPTRRSTSRTKSVADNVDLGDDADLELATMHDQDADDKVSDIRAKLSRRKKSA